jgi:(1->4)-alpha-D-glucan 1-alpha-D-glucosylmutase
MKKLTATARLQFHKDFPLAAATALVPYFDRLGISHLYASPLLRARAGSTHGYDIVDHNEINPELGGEPALRELVAALRQHGMGLILDIVPNHMGVGGAENAWWLDVLEWGRASPYADFFDIDWDPPDSTLRGRLLAPFLGSGYGAVLQQGDLRLGFDAADGRISARYYDTVFPINPRDYASILLTEGGALEEVARRFADLPADRDGMRRAAEEARQELRRPELRPAIDAALAHYAPDAERGRENLHRLLDRQNFRAASWRAASDEINWRRFFDVNALAGIRAELPHVFEATHRTVLRLYAEGLIDGVRIDHVDGLADPRGYLRKLRRRMQAEGAPRDAALQTGEPLIWVEKILATHERLPPEWLTDGTTGYDFMNEAAGVLHDPDGEAEMTRIWVQATGRPAEFEQEAVAARRQILSENLSSEVYATAVALHRIARRDLATRDITLTAIHRTMVEILAHFHAYRIYAGPGGMSPADRRAMDWAMAGARRTVRAVDRDLLELLAGWLSGDMLRQVPAGARRTEIARAMVRFQQLSAPTAAKSVEDTAFYRYGRLISRNEVGTEPDQFALPEPAFHAASRERRKRMPRGLLATATHDHKRGEDARARLAVLSEIPGEWEAALQRWTRLNAPLKRDLGGPAPDAADEVMLYQSIIGAWPLKLGCEDRAGLDAFRQRVGAWQQKALREAKRHSSWAAPNTAYEQACEDFLAGTLDPDRPARVAQDICAFVERIAAAGAVNGLSQMLLRVTGCGVPDLYQGCEFWDFSLVDPDNRRPVDFAARAQVLLDAGLEAGLEPGVEADDRPEAGDRLGPLMAGWRDGRIKLALLHRALKFRAAHADLFLQGTYTALKLEGKLADHALAYARSFEDMHAITVISRRPGRLGIQTTPYVQPQAWAGTNIVMPRSLSGLTLTDRLGRTGSFKASGRLRLDQVLGQLPVALLEAR